MIWHCSKCGMIAYSKDEFDGCLCTDGPDHEIHCGKPKPQDIDEEDDRELEDEALTEDRGFGPNDYAKTMGLDQDPDWEESYNFDDIGEGD